VSPEKIARLYMLLQIAGAVTLVAGGIVLLVLMATGAA
jgi:hypothetical protein